MKKNLFFALTMGVVMALGFAACGDDPKEPDPEEQKKGELAIVPAELTLAMGDTYRLTATLNGESVTTGVVWESSDAELVSVDQKGNIAASEEYSGVAEIKATVGEKSAVCKVTVQSFLETITFTQAIIWDIDTTVYEYNVKEAQGLKYIWAQAHLRVLSEGLYLNTSTYMLDGAEQGAVIDIYAAMAYATPGLNGGQGTTFCLGEWAVGDSADYYGMTGEPGYLENEALYTQYCFDGLHAYFFDGDQTALSNNLQLAGDLCKGTTMTALTYTYDAETQKGGYSSSRIPDGFVTAATFVANGNGFNDYMLGLQNVDIHVKHVDTETFWGLGADIDYAINEAGDDFTKFELASKKVKWADSEYHYVYLPDAAPLQAPARGGMKFQPLNVPVIARDMPEVAAKIDAQLNAAKHIRK